MARTKDSKVKARLFGAPVRLADAPPAEDGPVWIHVATEGRWEGHPSGGVVEFSRKSFEQIIKNFRANPWYSPGPDGVGNRRVIPYDYEHASEMSPTEGSIPETGAPAPAWATELQLRDGEDGKAQLWALTLLSTQAREQIREGGYLSTSVAVWPNAKDAVTNKPIGALLTSIAFTNHPFIKGMAPIAASMSVWGKAESAEEALVGLRDLLGLPADAAAAEVAVELETLRNAVANGMTSAAFPDGFGCLVDSVRRLLGLRVLATTDEILTTAGQLIVGVADPSAPAPQQATEDNTMTAPAAPAPALATALLGKLADLFNCRDSEPVLLAAAEKAKTKGDTLDQLLGLFESDDMTALLGDAAKTIEKAKKADEYLAGLTAVRERLGAADKKEAEQEVEQIAASMGLSGDTAAKFKPLLLTSRLACNVDDPKERETKLAAFYQQYPLPKVDPAKALLTQTVVAGPNGVQLLGGSPLPAAPAPGTVVPSPAPGNQPAHVQLFAAYPGRNEIEKACAYHKDKTPGFKELPFQTQVRAASGFVRTGQLAL